MNFVVHNRKDIKPIKDESKELQITFLLWVSLFAMISTFVFAMIAGPNICHAINICALAITIVVVIKWLNNNDKMKIKSGKVALIIFNIIFSLWLMSIKYGYFNRHYKNFFEIVVN